MIDSLNTKIKGIEEQSKTFEKSIALDDEELHYLKFWQIGFSPSGIRSFISDDLIDLLNQKVQENLNDLYDGALNILFESESEDSKGVTVNKISTNCFLDGKEVEISTLSDGQLNRAILATDLALMEVAESRSGTWLNVKFLDEPCANMDSAGQLQAFKLFNKLAKQKDGFFVISHDESFQSMCANTIHVLRQNGQSRIVTKDEFKRYSSDNVEENNIFEHKENKADVKSSDFLKEIVFKKKERKEEEED
jgi:DNA repair exonuclease SbcCD ATPase subunit